MEQPKTADGVTIRPGDTVWIKTLEDPLNQQILPFSQQVFAFEYRNDFWFVLINEWFTRVDGCYSSKEALIKSLIKITNDDIIEFLERHDIHVKEDLKNVIIWCNGFNSYGKNVVEAAKKSIIKERENGTT